jgi:hypothetical protein
VLNEVTDVADFLNLLYLKLSPWFKIKILNVTPWSVSFSIGEFDELFATGDSGWKLQTASNKPGTRGAASRHFANHLNGILSGSVRDDAGNLTARDISVFREEARRRSIEDSKTEPSEKFKVGDWVTVPKKHADQAPACGRITAIDRMLGVLVKQASNRWELWFPASHLTATTAPTKAGITPYSTTFFHKKTQKVELEKPWEPKVGDPVQFVFLGSTRHGDKGAVTMTTEGWPEKEYLFQSNCGKFGRWCTIAELEPIKPKPQRPIKVVRTIPEGFRLLAYEPRMSSDCYWSLSCKDWVLIGDRVEAANRDMWPAIRFVADKTMREASKTLESRDHHETDFATMPNHIIDANKKVDPSPSEEKPKDLPALKVCDPVVTFNGRRGLIEAFGLIEDFPITVRHSKREAVSYRLGDVWLDTDAKSVVKESLTAEPEPAPKKYRTPTILDLSNGPIRCEVCDDEDEVWTKRWLTFVSDRRAFPFVTVDPENKDKSGSWKRCRIEVAFDPVADLSQTAARMVGKAIDQMIHKGELVKPPQPEPVIKQSLIAESNCPEIPDSSNSSEIPNGSGGNTGSPWVVGARPKTTCDEAFPSEIQGIWIKDTGCPEIKIGSRDAFEAEIAKRCKLKADQLRTDGKGRYSDLRIEQYWQAFQAGAEWKSSNTDSYFVPNGYPCIRERVVVTRKSGRKLTARLAYTRDSSFRNCNNLHWLTDDDKFADVGFDPIVSWSREPVDAPSPSLAASDLAKGVAEKIRMKQLLDATSKPPKTLNAARDLNSQFWEEAYQIMISLFNSGLSVEQIKQELLSRLPEEASSK